MRSQAETISFLPPDKKIEALAGMDSDKLAYDPYFWLRPEQIEALDATEWMISLLAGRGFGKTRVGAEWVRKKAEVPGTRIALVGRTAADVRDVMIQGESGILAVSSPMDMPEYIPSLRRLNWPNGSFAITYSAEEPSQLRGPQHHYAWADELAAWRMKPDNSGLHAWDNLKIGCRLGDNPQIFMTTTPKRVPAIRKLIDMTYSDPKRIKFIKGRTMDNAGNLAATYIETITGMYANTSIARQELDGEFIDRVDGATWDEKWIRHTDDISVFADLNRTNIVAVDPTVAATPGDECGIVVVTGTTERKLHERRAWVIDDLSMRGSPEEWGKVVVDTAKKWNGIVVAEKNNGGDLVRINIHAIDPSIPVVLVSASKGKKTRADEVVLPYQQGRVWHFTSFPELEDQMTSWVEGESGYSPDRMDALVWGLFALFVDPKVLSSVSGPIRASKVITKARIEGVNKRGGGSEQIPTGFSGNRRT